MINYQNQKEKKEYIIKYKEVIKMEKQTQTNEWLDKEMENLNAQSNFSGVKLPALQLQENKISEFDIDFIKPFDKWNDEVNKTSKAIIPITQNGEDKVWWLNTKNPIYKDIIQEGKKVKKHFKVMQTGNQKLTKYNLVDDGNENLN